jgi:hypothetical protein
MSVGLLFEIVALVLFILAGLNVPSRVGLGWFGLACYMLALLIGGATLGGGRLFH